MVELKRIDQRWVQGKYLAFRDDGLLHPKALTRRYSVFSRHNKSLLGYVKWHGPWRMYTFIPLNSIFDPGCCIDVAQFMLDATKAHKDRKLDAAQRLATKTRRKNKLERLTNRLINDTIGIESQKEENDGILS